MAHTPRDHTPGDQTAPDQIPPHQAALKPSDDGTMMTVFAALLLMGAITVLILLHSVPDGVTGVPHPENPKMFMGAAKGAAQPFVLGLLPYLLLVSILVFVQRLMLLGIPAGQRTRGVRLFLAIALVAQIGVVTAFWFTYQEASMKGWAPMAGAFPMPTAIFLYCFYPVLAFYIFLYVVKFKSVVLSPETEAAFKDLVTEMKSIPETER